MDPDMREIKLRAHIRNLLFDYSQVHLTNDYISFTEDTVSQVIVDLSDAFSYINQQSASVRNPFICPDHRPQLPDFA